MTKKGRELTLTSFLATKNLHVTGDVLGTFHEFPLKGGKARIAIPGNEQIGNSVRHRRDNQSGRDYYGAIVVQISISTPDLTEGTSSDYPRSLQTGVASSTNDGKSMSIGTYSTVVAQAISRWIGVLRWIGDDYRISEFDLERYATRGPTNVRDSSTGATHSVELSSDIPRSITVFDLESWKRAELVLARGESPPIYCELSHEAQIANDRGDYRLATVYVAMACETFLRGKVAESLPIGLNSKIRSHIERASISQVYNNFLEEIIVPTEKTRYDQLRKELGKLFDQRNTIVHSGHDPIVDRRGVVQSISTMKDLFGLRFR